MVPWAKSLISRSTATPQPSIIIPVWPVATNDARSPAAMAARRSSSATDILPIGAIDADGQDHPLARSVAAPDGRLHPLRRPAVVDDRRPARRRGGPELRVVAEERVQPRVDVETGRDGLEDDRPPGVGSRPPVGAIPISRASGGFGSASASASVETIGMSWPGR